VTDILARRQIDMPSSLHVSQHVMQFLLHGCPFQFGSLQHPLCGNEHGGKELHAVLRYGAHAVGSPLIGSISQDDGGHISASPSYPAKPRTVIFTHRNQHES
jgi:hypothetical protein